MAITYASQIANLFDSYVGNDTKYQAPGDYGLSLAAISSGIGSITVGGTNNAYTSAPTVSVTPDSNFSGTGSGFTGTVNMKLAGASVNAAGTGYAPGNTVTLTVTGGTVATRPIITISTVKLVSATIAAGGTGFGNAQTFTLTVAGGTQSQTAQVSATSNAGGVVTTINSVSQAGSYTVLPTIAANAVTGGAGTGCTLNLVFGVNTITISTVGSATVIGTAATQYATSGSGTGFTANSMTWSVDSVTITAAGSGYEGVPTAAFSAGNATAVPVLSDSDEIRILCLIEIVRSFLASATSHREVKNATAVLRAMLDVATKGGSTFTAANVAAEAVKKGVRRYGRAYRG